ncbi:aminoglycoside phosphotransferase [Sorangium cellulosum]|uniref:Aminoglycoside phosphotransferase n=1 Tax=Sorangium cellulosum TaxID=56 RepID=A0A2L0EPQ9_SORCE|nr:phosphotransferase family protein [Sorangium cellulosum]AUX41260.1 aminoglycoside phosphotransferase [Sorangium cellulosum]
MTRATGRSGPVRPGEELDVAAVDRWLRGVEPSLEGTPEVTQYPGGASNWTYRLRYRNRDLVLRRAPAGTKARSAHDMAREYALQKALKPAYPVVPAMVGLCQDPGVLGTDFYVMERVEGFIPRARLPEGMTLSAADAGRLCRNMVDKLIELHGVDHRAVGLDRFSKGPGYPRRQVEGWSERYEKARTWNVPSFRYVRAWLKEHTPDDAGACVIHNDWRFDNVVLDVSDPTRVIGVLDWELATIGDPLMDLGSALAYWVEAGDGVLMRSTRRQPTHLPGMMRREEVVAYYLSKTGLRPASWAFYEVFGLFRLAGIAQQIYYRYFHKQTRNPAFRHLWFLVHYLDWRCRAILGRRGRR